MMDNKKNTAIVVHRGPWGEDPDIGHRRAEKYPAALRFVEEYINAIDSIDRGDAVWERFYANLAIYHDTKGEALVGGQNIWNRINRLLAPFAYVHHEPIEIRIVPCDVSVTQKIVYAQFMVHYLLKGDLNEEEILVPKFMIWTLGVAEDDTVGGGTGRNGRLVILDGKQFYDNAVIGRYVTEKRKREAKKRRFEGDEGGK